jgi:MFS family permease
MSSTPLNPGTGKASTRKAGSWSSLAIIATGLGALMAALAQTLVIPVLPDIGRDLHASTTGSQWLLTATLLVAAATVPVLSRFADMYGRRLLLVVSLAALGAGSLIDALTSNLAVMIVGRALTGLSAAAIPLGISLLAATLPAERKGSATALISAMLGVGSALGLPLAGLVADHANYHVLYWISVGGAALSIAFILALVAEPPVLDAPSVDLLGILLLAGGLVCLVLPLSEGSAWGWSSPATIGLMAGAVVLLGALVFVERREASPLVNMRALGRPPVAITNVASVFVGFALFASFVVTSSYVQAPVATGYGFGSSVLTAGLCLLPSGVLMLLLSPLTARLIRLWGGGPVLALGGVVIAAGLIVRIFAVSSLWEVIVGSAIVGAGTGVGYAALPSLINAHTPAGDLAAANGINSLARSLGSTLASAVGGSILAAITLSLGGASLPSLTAYRVLFAICTASALLAAVAGLVVGSPRLNRDRQSSPQAADTPVPASS